MTDETPRMSQPPPITFLYTNSYDRFADAIIGALTSGNVFRFNLDLWREYIVRIEPELFTITNPAGGRVHSSQIVKFLWRKPRTNQQLFPDRAIPREQQYEDDELAYAMREVWNRMYYEGRAVLIDPASHLLAGKCLQARVAGTYFDVPAWKFVSGSATHLAKGRLSVVKSLSAQPVQEKSVLYASRVREDQLTPATPWMIQDYVEAERDVTVVVVRDALFAFELDRSGFPPDVIDWRRADLLAPTSWAPHILPPRLATSIASFMRDMSLHYGRLDFLLAGSTYYFLEVNANGEWDWLDPHGDAGIVQKMVEELSPDTPCHPLPNPRTIKGSRS